MKRRSTSLRSILGVTVLVALILGAAWWWQGRAGQGTSTSAALSPLAEPISPLVTPTEWPTPTPWVEPTIPPIPTPLPTPVVTPIPLASPPFIPELAGKSTEPYRIVFRVENTLWIMNNDGSDLRVLFDAVKETGFYTRIIPWEGAEAPGKWSASPDGSRLALKLYPSEGPPKTGERTQGNIYILDIASGELRSLVYGGTPVWSPDSNRIAFLKESGLWVINVTTGEEKELFSSKEEYAIREIAWSPDAKRIAFSYGIASLGGNSERRVVDVDGPTVMAEMILPEIYGWGTAWLADGNDVLYVRSGRELTGQRFFNLWIADAATHATKPLTVHANIASFALSHSRGDWVVFSGLFAYEGESLPNDLWLLDASTAEIVRLSKNAPGDTAHEPCWSPDDTQIVFQKEEQGIWTLDLEDGSERQIHPSEPGVFYSNLAVLPGV